MNALLTTCSHMPAAWLVIAVAVLAILIAFPVGLAGIPLRILGAGSVLKAVVS